MAETTGTLRVTLMARPSGDWGIYDAEKAKWGQFERGLLRSGLLSMDDASAHAKARGWSVALSIGRTGNGSR